MIPSRAGRPDSHDYSRFGWSTHMEIAAQLGAQDFPTVTLWFDILWNDLNEPAEDPEFYNSTRLSREARM